MPLVKPSPGGGLGGEVVAVVPAAGLGRRFGSKKTFYELDGKPVLIRTLDALERVAEISEVIPALREEDHEFLEKLIEGHGIKKVKKLAKGGKERQDSVWNALRLAPKGTKAVAVHDGVRPFATPAFISGLIAALFENSGPSRCDGVVPGLMPRDTIKEITEDGAVSATLKREALVAVQTPQVFMYVPLFAAYEDAMARGFYTTDDAAIVEAAGGKVRIMPGLPRNIKITTPEDIPVSETILSATNRELKKMRTGFGYDSHRLVPGRKLMLGGVEIPFEKGSLGHSDGDALIHAIIDAILGALVAGDIGAHFPDTDPAYKGISSLLLLEKTLLLAKQKGFLVEQVDSTVIAQAPRLAPHIEAIRTTLQKALETPAVSVKAKSNEGMGFTGRGEGVAAFAVCVLKEIKD